MAKVFARERLAFHRTFGKRGMTGVYFGSVRLHSAQCSREPLTLSQVQLMFIRNYGLASGCQHELIPFMTRLAMHAAWVYILTNKNNTTFYVGMTNDLRTRVWEHHTKQNKKSFTSRYNINKLIYFEGFELITDAIARESYIKNQTRLWKIELIKSVNPSMDELPTDF